ncbi:MAG: hypothetical protein WC683_01375 [bacterium]
MARRAGGGWYQIPARSFFDRCVAPILGELATAVGFFFLGVIFVEDFAEDPARDPCGCAACADAGPAAGADPSPGADPGPALRAKLDDARAIASRYARELARCKALVAQGCPGTRCGGGARQLCGYMDAEPPEEIWRVVGAARSFCDCAAEREGGGQGLR